MNITLHYGIIVKQIWNPFSTVLNITFHIRIVIGGFKSNGQPSANEIFKLKLFNLLKSKSFFGQPAFLYQLEKYLYRWNIHIYYKNYINIYNYIKS